MGVHPRLPVPAQFNNGNMILSSSAEIAMQFWWGYLYSGDETFLREQAYPLMKSVAQFYLNYLEEDAQGRYIMYPSNAHETCSRCRTRRTTWRASATCSPPLEASAHLGVDAELRARSQERLAHLAPFAIDPVTGGIDPYEPRPGEKIPIPTRKIPTLSHRRLSADHAGLR